MMRWVFGFAHAVSKPHMLACPCLRRPSNNVPHHQKKPGQAAYNRLGRRRAGIRWRNNAHRKSWDPTATPCAPKVLGSDSNTTRTESAGIRQQNHAHRKSWDPMAKPRAPEELGSDSKTTRTESAGIQQQNHAHRKCWDPTEKPRCPAPAFKAYHSASPCCGCGSCKQHARRMKRQKQEDVLCRKPMDASHFGETNSFGAMAVDLHKGAVVFIVVVSVVQHDAARNAKGALGGVTHCACFDGGCGFHFVQKDRASDFLACVETLFDHLLHHRPEMRHHQPRAPPASGQSAP